MSSLDSIDLRHLTDILESPEVRVRLLSKTRFELQGLMLSEAARSTAWPLVGSTPQGKFAADWLPPGTYTLGELEERLAPRLGGVYQAPDPRYKVCETAIESSVLSFIKGLLVAEPEADVHKQAEAAGVDGDQLMNLCMELLGAPLVENLLAEVKAMSVTLSLEQLRDAARRHALTEAAELAERHHAEQSHKLTEARYEKLRLQWLAVAGDRGTSRLSLKSSVLPIFHEWLQSLPIEDAAIFMFKHEMSKGVAAGNGLPQEYVEKLATTPLPEAATRQDVVYARLRALLDDILSIPGRRLVTITTHKGQFIRMDIDPCNRFGHHESHLSFLIDELYQGFISSAGVMVRALEGGALNIYSPREAKFVTALKKSLYGVYIHRRNYMGYTEEQVRYAHTHDMTTDAVIPRDPTVTPRAWPTGAGAKRLALPAPSKAAPDAGSKPATPPQPPEPPVGV